MAGMLNVMHAGCDCVRLVEVMRVMGVVVTGALGGAVDLPVCKHVTVIVDWATPGPDEAL